MIEEGQAIVRACLRRNQPGAYQLQAAINAVHAERVTSSRPTGSQIVALYDQLLAIAPTPVVALNRAIAIGEVQGPAAALALVDELDLDDYYPFHATRADLLARLGRDQRGRGRVRTWRRTRANGVRAGVSEARRQISAAIARLRCLHMALTRNWLLARGRHSVTSEALPRSRCSEGCASRWVKRHSPDRAFARWTSPASR